LYRLVENVHAWQQATGHQLNNFGVYFISILQF
jgi:hypothetical protein